MSGLRFEVGELAIFMFARRQEGIAQQGLMVTIEMVGPFPAGFEFSPLYNPSKLPFDYVLQNENGEIGYCKDFQLRKIEPPAEPASLVRELEGEIA